MKHNEPLIYTTILDNMEDGVVSVDDQGRIVTYNGAAARILGMPESEAIGRVIGEVFVLHEGLDQFTQAMLDAVGERREAGRKIIEIDVGGKRSVLTINTSYRRAESGDHRIGLIGVFSEITEVLELRDTEVRLGKKIKAQYEELSNAYRVIEERNEELEETIKRGRVVRAVAVAAVVVVFLWTGYFVWDRSPNDPAPVTTFSERSGEPLPTITVEPQPLRTTISLPGRLVSRQDTHVVSPIVGRVSQVHFRYGDEVQKDMLLVTLDTSRVVQEHRALRASFIKADSRLKELEDWENSRDMAAARRSLSRARRTLENQKQAADQTELLLERGIIPASEHESAIDRYENAKLDFEATQQDMLAVQEKGSGDSIEVARLEHRNLSDQLRELEASMEQATVRAPVAGVVMERPSGGGFGLGGGGRLVEGEEVQQGDPLLTIADVDSFAVVGTVDEVEIVKLRVDQPVTVTSDAFPGIELQGVVTNVSSQAVNVLAGSGEPAMFSMAAAVLAVDPSVRPLLRLGMSADLQVVTRDDAAALLVPVAAVNRERDGSHSLRVLDPATGDAASVAVETGTTTWNLVEILSGVDAGDEVVISSDPGRP